MNQLSALNAFCRVVKTGSHSAAAIELNVSHSVLPRQVRRLGTMLGAQLVNRTSRTLALPDAGHTDHECAYCTLDQLHDAAVTSVGFATTTSFLMQDDVAPGWPPHVHLDYPMHACNLYAAYPRNSHRYPKVRDFINFASDIDCTPAWS